MARTKKIKKFEAFPEPTGSYSIGLPAGDYDVKFVGPYKDPYKRVFQKDKVQIYPGRGDITKNFYMKRTDDTPGTDKNLKWRNVMGVLLDRMVPHGESEVIAYRYPFSKTNPTDKINALNIMIEDYHGRMNDDEKEEVTYTINEEGITVIFRRVDPPVQWDDNQNWDERAKINNKAWYTGVRNMIQQKRLRMDKGRIDYKTGINHKGVFKIRVPVGTYRVIVKSKAGRYVNFGEEFFVPADPDNTVHPKIIYVAHQALPLTLPNVLWDAPQSAWKWGGVPGRWGNKGWNRLKTQPGLKNKALGLGQGLFGYLGAGIFGAAGLGLGSELGLFTRGFNKWYTGLAKRPHGLKPGWDWLEEQVNKRKEEKDDEK